MENGERRDTTHYVFVCGDVDGLLEMEGEEKGGE